MSRRGLNRVTLPRAPRGLSRLARHLHAPAVHAENGLRTMIATDIRGLMPGISPDDSTGLVLQHVYEGLVAWRTDGIMGEAEDLAARRHWHSHCWKIRA